ncbi:MAG: S41 family peptidase [Cyanobacteria bacterium P01_H01_bin.74]
MATTILTGCQTLSLNPGFQLKNSNQAEQLYDEAWRAINEEYVDNHFNGQSWQNWRTHYKNKLKTLDDAYVAIATMTTTLNDEYTRFLRPRAMKEQNLTIDSRLYGVGIQISMLKKRLVVLATLDDTPAARAGMKPKDVITHINGYEASGISVSDAADRIRGKKGTWVSLTLLRDGEQLVKKIQRDEIKLKSVFTRDLKDKQIGYLRFSSFISETMLSEVKAVENELKQKKALIIDLRGNYGGLFSNAVEIADMFLKKGDIVSIVNREKVIQHYEANGSQVFKQPVAVLIDAGSASASEIFSGALKDNHRGTLVGEHTFGKGLVQKITPLSQGAGLNITISKYLTPNGQDIHKKGILPDVKVAYTAADLKNAKDPQLDKAIEILRQQL